jgi:microcystin-dependent protein
MSAILTGVISVVVTVAIIAGHLYLTKMNTPPPILPKDLPIGTIVPFAGTSMPDGWIACDNKSYPPTTYPELYAKIGYTYGMDGMKFRVPDTRGVFMRGIDATATRDTNRPAGSIQMSVSMDYMPTGMIMMWYPPLATITSLSLAASYVPEGWAICDGTKGTPDLRGRFVMMAADTPAPVAGGTIHPVRQIGGEETHVVTIAEMPSHTHPGAGTDLTGHNYNSYKTVAWSGTSGATGGNQPHNTMPPFYSLIYIMRI